MVGQVINLERKDRCGRDLSTLHLNHLSELLADLNLPSKYFACFLACNSDDLSVEEISKSLEELLSQGMVYLSIWGPGCERVHDICGEVEVEREVIRKLPERTIMTTWHEEESLEEALSFFTSSTCPDDEFVNECNASLIITVGNGLWDQIVKEYLSLHD